MEFTLVTVVIALLIVWYFGKPLNAVVAGTGEMASDEFAVMRREQKIRLHKERIKQTGKIKDLADQEVFNDQKFNDFFNVMTDHKEEN